MNAAICEAIKKKAVIEFNYKGAYGLSNHNVTERARQETKY